jgi:hypothetical protein
VSTAKKRGKDLFSAIAQVFEGVPVLQQTQTPFGVLFLGVPFKKFRPVQ